MRSIEPRGVAWNAVAIALTVIATSACSASRPTVPDRPRDDAGMLLRPPTTLSWGPMGREASQEHWEAQGLTLDGKLWVMGGFTANFPSVPNVTEVMQAYDPSLDEWVAGLPPMPTKLTHAGQAGDEDGRAIYLAGGFLGDHPGGSTDGVWRYRLDVREWTAGPPLPALRGGGTLALLAGSLHFFGGASRDAGGDAIQADHGDHWVLPVARFDEPGAAWAEAAPMPNPRNHLGGCVVDGLIYAVGGQHRSDEGAGNQASVDVYHADSDTWTAAAPLLVPTGHISANVVVWRGRILVVAGVTASGATAAIFEYDPRTDAWEKMTSLPEPRQSPVSGVIGDTLIVSAGARNAQARRQTWIGRLSRD